MELIQVPHQFLYDIYNEIKVLKQQRQHVLPIMEDNDG